MTAKSWSCSLITEIITNSKEAATSTKIMSKHRTVTSNSINERKETISHCPHLIRIGRHLQGRQNTTELPLISANFTSNNRHVPNVAPVWNNQTLYWPATATAHQIGPTGMHTDNKRLEHLSKPLLAVVCIPFHNIGNALWWKECELRPHSNRHSQGLVILVVVDKCYRSAC
jgi:hypothetical protein